MKKTVAYAQENGFACNVYLEDWSNGIKNSPDYVWKMLDCYAGLGFERIILPDTLGVLNPFETEDYIRETVRRYPKAEFEFHPHNDYGMAAANALAAVRAGISGLHVTVNGLGERTGNVDLAQAAVAINDHSDAACKVNEKKLKDISILVETFSGKRIAGNMPILGSDVFTQTAGIHADGDKKGNLYVSSLTPDRFDRNRSYALGKLSGKASLEMNLDKVRIHLNDDRSRSCCKRLSNSVI